MRILKIFLRPLCATITLWLLWGCSTKQPDVFQSATDPAQNRAKLLNKDHDGHEYIFTNANVVAWVPVSSIRVWDADATSGIQIGETTPPDAFVRDYKIYVEIQINTEKTFERNSEMGGWYFQEHPVLSMRDRPVGKQLRKDVRDLRRGRILMINAMVKTSSTFDTDLDMAKKIVESITLISK